MDSRSRLIYPVSIMVFAGLAIDVRCNQPLAERFVTFWITGLTFDMHCMGGDMNDKTQLAA